jgi:hypothetical protein
MWRCEDVQIGAGTPMAPNLHISTFAYLHI